MYSLSGRFICSLSWAEALKLACHRDLVFVEIIAYGIILFDILTWIYTHWLIANLESHYMNINVILIVFEKFYIKCDLYLVHSGVLKLLLKFVRYRYIWR